MNHCHFRRFTVIAAGIMVAGLVMSGNLAAAPTTLPDEQIVITADQLETGGSESYIEFSGNVLATQGTTSIRADSLKIYYKEQTSQKAPANSQDNIEKIIAHGGVIITMDERTATTQQAVYTTADQVLVLSGKNSKITSGKDQISGAQITFYRQTGRVKVAGDKSQRVKAIIFPQSTPNP